MQLTLLNLTGQEITCSWTTRDGQQDVSASPSFPTITNIPRYRRKLRFSLSLAKLKLNEAEPEWKVDPASSITQISLSTSASWQVVSVPGGCPWSMYSTKIAKKHYQVTILPKRRLDAFLADMPDTIPLSSLLLPGTHDTMAFYGWPISQCQELSTPLHVQLESGIRVLDIRLSLVKGRLIAYHGVYPQKTLFSEILTTMHEFLTSPQSSRETIVMSLKQEDYIQTSQQDFSKAVHEDIAEGPGGLEMFYFRNAVPTLGEVRGKVVMFSRFNGWDEWEDGLGIHPPGWPDSERKGFTWECENATVRTQDWYSIPSFLAIPEKIALATEILRPPEAASRPTLSISYFSAASFPFAAPPTIAQGFGWPKWGLGVEGVNSRVGKWLLDQLTGSFAGSGQSSGRPSLMRAQLSSCTLVETEKHSVTEPRLRGWALLDYFDNPEHALVPLLVECNYRGRVHGEEGW